MKLMKFIVCDFNIQSTAQSWRKGSTALSAILIVPAIIPTAAVALDI